MIKIIIKLTPEESFGQVNDYFNHQRLPAYRQAGIRQLKDKKYTDEII